MRSSQPLESAIEDVKEIENADNELRNFALSLARKAKNFKWLKIEIIKESPGAGKHLKVW